MTQHFLFLRSFSFIAGETYGLSDIIAKQRKFAAGARSGVSPWRFRCWRRTHSLSWTSRRRASILWLVFRNFQGGNAGNSKRDFVMMCRRAAASGPCSSSCATPPRRLSYSRLIPCLWITVETDTAPWKFTVETGIREEVETLCSRLTVMRAGQLVAIGSVQELKSK